MAARIVSSGSRMARGTSRWCNPAICRRRIIPGAPLRTWRRPRPGRRRFWKWPHRLAPGLAGPVFSLDPGGEPGRGASRGGAGGSPDYAGTGPGVTPDSRPAGRDGFGHWPPDPGGQGDGVPALVEVQGVAGLPEGEVVTVDAYHGKVYQGRVEPLLRYQRPHPRYAPDSPVLAWVRAAADLIIPLNLVDRRSKDVSSGELPHLPRYHPFLAKRKPCRSCLTSWTTSPRAGCRP